MCRISGQHKFTHFHRLSDLEVRSVSSKLAWKCTHGGYHLANCMHDQADVFEKINANDEVLSRTASHDHYIHVTGYLKNVARLAFLRRVLRHCGIPSLLTPPSPPPPPPKKKSSI